MKTKVKRVFGVGINDADYVIKPTIRYRTKINEQLQCPYYARWYELIRRCYSKRYQGKYPTYKGCSVCKEWIYFSNFKKWMEQQQWEGRQLDKDFLTEGIKEYSPSTCVFIPQKVNKFLTLRGNNRGHFPVGANLKKGYKIDLYQASCNNETKRIYLGLFSTPEEAHLAWLKKKLEICKDYLVEFKNEPLIVKGLTRIKDRLEYHIETRTELVSF